MNLPSLITDNITELLVKIIEFTQRRQKILIRNINNVRSPGFVPKDLAVDEFSSG
jgi:flagellar basal body rod protein FlgB